MSFHGRTSSTDVGASKIPAPPELIPSGSPTQLNCRSRIPCSPQSSILDAIGGGQTPGSKPVVPKLNLNLGCNTPMITPVKVVVAEQQQAPDSRLRGKSILHQAPAGRAVSASRGARSSRPAAPLASSQVLDGISPVTRLSNSRPISASKTACAMQLRTSLEAGFSPQELARQRSASAMRSTSCTRTAPVKSVARKSMADDCAAMPSTQGRSPSALKQGCANTETRASMLRKMASVGKARSGQESPAPAARAPFGFGSGRASSSSVAPSPQQLQRQQAGRDRYCASPARRSSEAASPSAQHRQVATATKVSAPSSILSAIAERPQAGIAKPVPTPPSAMNCNPRWALCILCL